MDHFTKIGRAITSLGAVIFVQMLWVGAMIFFSHTLFTDVLPSYMTPWEKKVAAWFIAFAWEFIVLVTTCNVKFINKHIPPFMAICSGIILLYFLDAFDWSQPALVISERWFVSILIATVNFILSDLFYKRWMEFNESISLPGQVNELQSEVNQLRSQLNDSQSSLNEARSLKAFKAKIERELTCKHCNTPFESYGSLHAHKGHCSKNPKNLTPSMTQ